MHKKVEIPQGLMKISFVYTYPVEILKKFRWNFHEIPSEFSRNSVGIFHEIPQQKSRKVYEGLHRSTKVYKVNKGLQGLQDLQRSTRSTEVYKGLHR